MMVWSTASAVTVLHVASDWDAVTFASSVSCRHAAGAGFWGRGDFAEAARSDR